LLQRVIPSCGSCRYRPCIDGAHHLSTSPISKLPAADDERRQAKRNSLADKLTVEAKALADLKIEKAAV
jgi:hypothetical protein